VSYDRMINESWIGRYMEGSSHCLRHWPTFAYSDWGKPWTQMIASLWTEIWTQDLSYENSLSSYGIVEQQYHYVKGWLLREVFVSRKNDLTRQHRSVHVVTQVCKGGCQVFLLYIFAFYHFHASFIYSFLSSHSPLHTEHLPSP
jgi:hypothetical protein